MSKPLSNTYVYSISSDFLNASTIDAFHLKMLISQNQIITTEIEGVSTFGDNVTISFVSSLSSSEVTELNSVVANYTNSSIPFISSSKLYDAYVSNNPYATGDYTSIAAAYAAGHSSVFIRKGTYYETSDIVIPNGGQFYGEAPGYVFVVLLGGAKVISDAVTGNPSETIGTISIANNTNQVVGTGTTFTNLSPGQFILIGSNYFPIASIQDDTHLTTVDINRGQTMTNKPLKANSIYSGISIQNGIFYGSTNEALHIRGVRNSSFGNLAFYNCGKGVIMKDSADLSIVSFVINHCGGVGYEIDSCYSLSLNIVNNYNNGGNGFTIKGNSFNINIQTSTAESNGGHGFYFTDTANLINLTEAVVKYNLNDGIYMDTNTQFVSLSSLESAHNGGYGVNLKGKNIYVGGGFILDNGSDGILIQSSSECCSIESNSIGNNSSYGINASGTKTTMTENHIGQNTSGGMIFNGLNNSSISNNVITSSPEGIVIESPSLNLILTSNIIKDTSSNSIKLKTGTSKCIVSQNIVDVSVDNLSTDSINVNNLVV